MRILNKKGFVFHAEYLIVITAVLAGLLIARPAIQGAATTMLSHVITQIRNLVTSITFGG